MIRALLSILALGVAMATPAAAQPVAANIVTGGPGGTYVAIGRDIAGLGAECGLSLTVRESAGSVENMEAVRDRRATQFGIVQSDVLEYYRTFEADDPDLRREARDIRIVFPLYDEEVHVLARADIAGPGDLAGKRVAVGPEGSGTRLTAGIVLDLLQVAPAARLDLAPAAALEALLAGEIDAFFYVVGAPAALLADPRLDGQGYHLLPMTAPVLAAVYTPARIPGATYGFAAEPVETVAVRAVLVTFDFARARNSYQAASCRVVADVSHLILTRFDRLRADGHPKWKDIDPTDLPPGWEVSDCALDGVDPGYAFSCRKPDGSVVEEGATAGEANRLFLERVCGRIGCEAE